MLTMRRDPVKICEFPQHKRPGGALMVAPEAPDRN